jgi:tyrosine-protein phosphatase YwqE
MFNIFSWKKQVYPFQLSAIGVDMHSHLIPGIDDGAKTVEDSIQLIRGLQELGYSKIITTPHVYSEHYPNTKEDILKGLDILKSVMKEQSIAIPLEVSAEYFMDDEYEKLLDRNEVLPLAKKYVLVEMSFFGAPLRLDDYLFKTQTKGFQPILAHPERYVFMKGNMALYEELKDKGCLFQVNLLSLAGYYGESIAHTADKLIKNKMIDFLGTDMHHETHLSLLKQSVLNGSLKKLLNKIEEFENIKLLNES